MSLVVDHLSKRFGPVVALDDLVFEVPPGQVFGFLGANGAGKTTTMRITLGVLEADAGPGDLAGDRHPPPAALDVRVPAGGARAVPADEGARPARLLRGPPGRADGHRAARRRMAWLARFRAEDLAGRRAEQLSKGNQQKIQFIAAVLHEPQVLLMDEPFTGLDPVNVMLLREAFLELRDRGRTVVFSTHQMEVAEALCESVAIVDRGRMVVGGPIRDVRRATGRRLVRVAVDGDHRLPWLASVPGTRVIQAGMDRSSVELDPGVEPDEVLAAAMAAGARVRHFELADPSLEQVFIDVVGRPVGRGRAPRPRGLRAERRRRRRRGRPHAVGTARGGPGVSPSSPTARNAWLVARREYGERVGSRAFLISTLLLMGLAVVIALIPLAVRAADRASVTTIAVAAPDAGLSDRTASNLEGFINSTGQAEPNGPQGVRAAHDGQPGGGGRGRPRRVRGGRGDRRADPGRRPRLPGRHDRRPAPGQAAGAPARDVRGRRHRLHGLRPGHRAPVPGADVRGRGRGRRGGRGRRRHGRHRHRGVRQPADRRDRVRRALVPDPRVLRPVGRVRGRRREGEPGHGAADLRRDRAPARDGQDPGHRARRPDTGAAGPRARAARDGRVRADRQRAAGRGPDGGDVAGRAVAGARRSRSSSTSRSGSRSTPRSTRARARS